jgi:hypothetical protein
LIYLDIKETIKETIEKKKALLEMKFETYNRYIPCLRSNSDKIIEAMENDEDVEAILAVFRSCRIPKKAWLMLLIEIKKCYDSEFQSWTLG